MKINVIDNIGYVKYVKHWGDDLDVVNTARVSFDKESKTMEEKDISLLTYLLKNKHVSPFRHQGVTLEVYCPMFVKNQWIKHQVGSTFKEAQDGWNESSRRYVTEEPEFYVPKWREAPNNMKQGSGERVNDFRRDAWTLEADVAYSKGINLYNLAMEDGIAPEQARCFLPAYALYIRYRWTISLDGLLHFLSLRLDSHAQWEIQEYAKAVYNIVKPLFPETIKAWENLNE